MKTKAISSFFVLFAIVAGLVATTPAAFADHTEVTISTAPGSGTPGCEDTAEGCFVPKEATVDVGGKVIFSNMDTAAHTFTAGVAETGPTGEFDSSLVVPKSSYEWTPTTAGKVPYFCMVHPWMAGLIVVQEAGAEESTTTSPSDEGLMVDIATGNAGQGEKLSIDLTFTTMSGASVEHVNYDIKATQNGEVVLNEMGVHAMGNVNNHMTSPLPAAASGTDPVNVEVMFKGYGVPGSEMTGPVGKVTTKQVVPEFGTIAMMILAVSIISIVAVTAKSKVIPRF
ncbi:MAG: PEFG-CTERM sorting domain-containing protein [Nitrosopumilus sp.]|jgi:predicted secreted protein with PEFG-CTERM motif|nr:PEFG-CTERM sorting domain-containing protein [Nitrosopumilus sp.]